MAEFDIRQTDRLLTTTRAVRKRLDLSRPVDPAVVLECLRVATQAPTGSNAQKWRWMVVTDPGQEAATSVSTTPSRSRSTWRPSASSSSRATWPVSR